MDNISQKELEEYAKAITQELESEKQRRMYNERQGLEIGGNKTKDVSMITFLLDARTEIEKTEHFLRGDVFVKGVWQPTKNKIFTDLGVQEIMNHAILPHMSVSIVVGNITEEQLILKMRIFYRWLTRFILNRAEDFFFYPKTEEIYQNYLHLKRTDRDFFDITDENLYNDAQRRSLGELQIKISHLPMIVQQIVNLVHARYSASIDGRAFKELMRNTHVSEVTSTTGIIGGGNKPKMNLLKPSTWR